VNFLFDDVLGSDGPVAQSNEAVGRIQAGVEVLLVSFTNDESCEVAIWKNNWILLHGAAICRAIESTTDAHELQRWIPDRIKVLQLGTGGHFESISTFSELEGEIFHLTHACDAEFSVEQIIDLNRASAMGEVDFLCSRIVDESLHVGEFPLQMEDSA
jgi:hypothetical protein